MAKDKRVETNYKIERLKRTAERKTARKVRNKYRTRHDKGLECPDCGGQMSWCSCCEVWSQSCHVEYGTCMCS